MSNMETSPEEVDCQNLPGTIEILEPRKVPLGGPRAMTVSRTLPQRQRSLIGAWCFIDHYGPDDVTSTQGMKVPPHPHTGLQTVSWLFEGTIDHTDSAGNHAQVRPGELNLMTAGTGISHTEYSTATTTTLHGVQLWLALPDAHRFVTPGFAHYAPPSQGFDGGQLKVFLGTLNGETSPVDTFSPLLGAEIVLEPNAEVTFAVDPSFEHGYLIDSGSLSVEGEPLARYQLGYTGTGKSQIHLKAGDEGSRFMLLGGEPLGESIIMWWNFVGRTHEEIVAFRTAWQAQIAFAPSTGGPDRDPAGMAGATSAMHPHFGLSANYIDAPLPAPALPTVRLRPRENPTS